uniref:Non-structural protein n=1 Tax=Electric ant polycipivirus 1 TaxID=3003605 RepID=A0AA95E7G8_9VIRU|nr:non-structural protein [Electric ant polycipivirus 1]
MASQTIPPFSSSMDGSNGNRLHGRKKFNLRSEIVAKLASLGHQTADEWVYVPRKDLMKRFVHDFNTGYLYVGGGEFKTLSCSLDELLHHITILPYPVERQAPLGKKLKSVPVFYHNSLVHLTHFMQEPVGQFKPAVRTTHEMISAYEICELEHKRAENHHPDSDNYSPNMKSSIEVTMDVFSCLLATAPLRRAYETLLKVLGEKKFRGINADGVYVALLHILIRGVANGNIIRDLRQWRTKRSQEELVRLHLDYANGVECKDLRSDYTRELRMHCVCVTSEMIRMRLGTPKHDWSKWNPYSIYFYSWNWGIYQQLTCVNKYRVSAGLTTTQEEFMKGKETMFSYAGSSFAKGLAESQELNDKISSIGSLIEESVLGATEKAIPKLKEAVREESSSLTEEARGLVEDLTNRLEDVSDAKISRIEGIVERLSNTFESLLSSFDAVRVTLSSVFDKIKASVSAVPGLSVLDVSFEGILAALRDYILFVNVDSKILKSVIAISLLKNLGILKLGYKYFLDLCSYIQLSGTETAGFTDIMSSGVTNLVHVVCGVLASVSKGAALTSDQFWSMVKTISEPMKHIHFIGSGCLGITRIFDFIKRIYESLSEWILKHVLGRLPEQEQLARDILIWAVKVKYFNTEAGLSAIRMNEQVRKVAGELFPQYLELSAKARSKADYRLFLNDVERHKKDVQNIYDYIVRLDAMSTWCPTMFHVQFVGQPGVGKSHMTKDFIRDLSASLWKDDEKESFYSYNPNLEFFDGYAGQRIFLMDDAFRMQEPKHLTTLIGLVTNTPVVLPMANLVDKGTQLTSDVMLSSTNTPWPIGKDVLCMEAVHRRRHMLVEVVMDEDVRDASTGQFSKAKYLRKYKEEDLPSYPHVSFNLLRPVPREMESANIQMCSSDQYSELQHYAEKLKLANATIETPGLGSLDPTFYFSKENQPPEPYQLPCRGWSYNELIHNAVVRYRAFRGEENSYNPKRRYAHVEYAIHELENLFCQSNDIRDQSAIYLQTHGVDGDPYPLIKRWFSEVHHPFGVSDPVGSRLLSTPDSGLAPELSDLDVDAIVSEVIDSHIETGLTLEEEMARTQALRARNQRLRTQEPLAMRERLRVVKIDRRPYIPLNSHATRWDGFSSQSGINQRMDKLWEATDMESMLKDLYFKDNLREIEIKKEYLKEFWQFKNQMTQYVYGANAHFPDMEEFGDLRGKKTTFPLYFLQKLCLIGSRWYLDIGDCNNEKLMFWDSPEVSVVSNGTTYSVPGDMALVLSVSGVFRAFMTEFDCLTTEQQKLLVQEAQWRNQYTGFYTIAKMKEDMKSSMGKMTLTALEYLLSPITYLTHKVPCILEWVGHLVVFGIAVWTLTSMAKLLLGSTTETSKFLHRGPESHVRYYGRVTSSFEQEEQFVSGIMSRNVKDVRIDTGKGMVSVQGLMTGKYLIMPKHVIRDVTLDHIHLQIGQSGTGDQLTFVVPRRQFVEMEHSDLCMVTDRCFPQVASVDGKFITDEQFDNYIPSGILTFMSRLNNNAQIEHHPSLRKAIKPSMRLPDGRAAYLDKAILAEGSTISGKSGSTVIQFSPQHRGYILGIQVWSVGRLLAPEIAIQVITRELFLEMKAKCDELNPDLVHRLVDPEYDPPAPEELSGVFTSLEVNQVVSRIPERVGLVGKTQFKSSPIASYMDMENHGSRRVPAALNKRDPRLNSPVHPLHHSVNKYVRGTVQALEPCTRSLAVQGITSYIAGVLDKSRFRTLTLPETITGTREDGSNPMDLNSSPGLPFLHTRKEKGKKDHFRIDESGEVDYINPDTRAEYFTFLSFLRRRQLPLTWAYDFPKDELRPEAKVCGNAENPPKTRTVTCMNMFYVLAWRQYTLDFWASMHRAADGTFPFCPGINPDGPEWSKAFHYLNRHPNVVDFDVSNWDGYLTSEMLLAAGDIMKGVLKANDETASIIDSILFEVFNSYIQYDTTLYQKFRGMISGFPGTAEVNTLVHWLLSTYFYLLMAPPGYDNMEAFRKHVSLLIYGDDIIISFSDEIKPWYNGITIAHEYSVLGYPVTSASKTGEIEASKSIWEATFLKSSWRLLMSHIYVRKMDESVAYDLLYWVRAKDDPDEQFMSNVVDSIRIMFGHGAQAYDEFVQRLNRWLHRAGFAPVLYSYRDLEVDHLRRYYNI